jgi:PAS domain S-box-containing protein
MNIESEYRRSLPLYAGEFHRAVKKGRQDLLNVIEGDFSKISRDEYAQIDKRWMGSIVGINPAYLRYILYSSMGAALLVVILMLWNYTLRKRVFLKTSELQLTLEALKESEEKYRELVQNANSIILRMDNVGNVTFFNEFAQHFFGYREVEIVGQNVVGTIVPELESTGRDLKQVIEDIGLNPDRYVNNINENVRRNGERVWVAWTNRPLLHEDGRVVEILCVGNDITERRAAEQAVHASEAKFRSYIESAPLAVFVADQQGRLIEFNCTAINLLGYDPAILRNMNILDLHPEEDREEVLREFSTLLEAGHVETECRMKKYDGQLIWVSLRAVMTSDQLSLSYCQDITDRKRAEEQRKKLEEQLFQSQKMESVGRLAGGVAHDFNNMLGVIIGRAEMALNTGVSTDELGHNLEEILKAGLRSADLTRQLLAFARKQTAIPEILDLNDTISGMLNMLRRLIGEDIDLSWQPGLDLWKVKIDPSQVDQILANLVVNARDAISGVGAVTMRTENVVIDDSNRIETPEFIPGEYVLLTVNDTGAGMSQEVRENIFEPFFTTKEVGKGTGLGLSTVYGIVKQNDGFIYVGSEPGKGTTFKIYLPRFEAETVQVSSEVAAGKPPTGTEIILLVEDDEAILNLGKMILENLGYTVLAAQTPVHAIHLVEEHPGDIHLLITDVVMPEMHGRELAEQLSAIRPNLKCLYMSGYTADVIAHRGILDEGVNFIQKPFRSDDLAARVRQVLDNLE